MKGLNNINYKSNFHKETWNTQFQITPSTNPGQNLIRKFFVVCIFCRGSNLYCVNTNFPSFYRTRFISHGAARRLGIVQRVLASNTVSIVLSFNGICSANVSKNLTGKLIFSALDSAFWEIS